MKAINMAATMSLVLLLSACSTTGPYGNYLEPEAADAYGSALAEDVAKQMVRAWPPAKTELALTHPASDGFGLSLVDALRSRGFAVKEYARHKSGGDKAESDEGSEFRYVVDKLDQDLLRVTVAVGPESISRAYATGGGLTPAGNWTVRTE